MPWAEHVEPPSRVMQNWVQNFSPGSTAEQILRWLLQRGDDTNWDEESLVQALLDYKGERNLGRVDLLQLRDYAEFQAGLVALDDDNPDVQVRKNVARVVEKVIRVRGTKL